MAPFVIVMYTILINLEARGLGHTISFEYSTPILRNQFLDAPAEVLSKIRVGKFCDFF